MADLDMYEGELSYIIHVEHYHKDNLILHLARICKQEITEVQGCKIIQGIVPCYIKGDGKRVYILRLNGTKLANIYPDGTIGIAYLNK